MDETYHGNAVDPLVDDELWTPLLASARGARESLAVTQLLWDLAFAPHGEALCDLVEEATRRGVRVRVLMNENAAVPDSYDDLADRFARTSVEVARLLMTPNVLHAKLFLVDGREAFLVDAPFEPKYVDASTHPSGGTRAKGAVPLHAVSLRARGPVVARLGDLFESLWARAHGAPLAPLPPRPARADPPAGAQSVRVAWSAPAGLVSEADERRILDEYVAAIGRARRFVYVETQYFTDPTVRDALVDATRRGVDVILVCNVHMDVPGYDGIQELRLAETGWPENERLGVFHLWAQRHARPELRQVYVHSKVALVDDAWATVGSANLDAISLEDSEDFIVRAPRNVEVNLVLLDGIDGAPRTGLVERLRRRLWGEHLGDAGVWRAAPAEGDWLALWRRAAQENARRFAAGERMQGRVMAREATPGRGTLRRSHA